MQPYALFLDFSSCRRIKSIMSETAQIAQVLHAIGQGEEGAAKRLLPLTVQARKVWL